MVTVTQDMKDMIEKQLAYIATADTAGNPDVGPKMTMRLYDDSHLIYNEFTGKQTLKNIQQTSKAAVAFVDRQAMKGFRFSGRADIYSSGPFYDSEAALEKAAGRPAPKQVGVIRIDQIFLLDIGPKAGTLVSD
ncbi:pyridoxamine 5'-phosphate oxidase family protein [Levilactobacillus bambusae]|uniref:Pyridoxamine 5'-phosphate oxidase N-terminal domain-containing protein n=1 Tax=Levilactobacillus bambusae TaxID=2024736 RepID=A0A2V1MXC9_9LACO|nr:pyridoxamine 5'-phosphate oxidase family protein [Levilactobacillus bambusae]PWF99668.1 hypothetical protein DCM90_07580 [Levilactobacillus bambusae]